MNVALSRAQARLILLLSETDRKNPTLDQVAIVAQMQDNPVAFARMYADRFIRLRRSLAEARESTKSIDNEHVRGWLLERLCPNQCGFVTSQFVCWLFAVGLKVDQVKKWFNQELCCDNQGRYFWNI